MRFVWGLLCVLMFGVGCRQVPSRGITFTIEDADALSKATLPEAVFEAVFGEVGTVELDGALDCYTLVDLVAGINRLQIPWTNYSFDEQGKGHWKPLEPLNDRPRVQTEAERVFSEIRPFVRLDEDITWVCNLGGVPPSRIDVTVAAALYLWAQEAPETVDEALMEEVLAALDNDFFRARNARAASAFVGLTCCLQYHSLLHPRAGRVLTQEAFFQACRAASLEQMKRIVTSPNWAAKVKLLLLNLPTEKPLEF